MSRTSEHEIVNSHQAASAACVATGLGAQLRRGLSALRAAVRDLRPGNDRDVLTEL